MGTDSFREISLHTFPSSLENHDCYEFLIVGKSVAGRSIDLHISSSISKNSHFLHHDFFLTFQQFLPFAFSTIPGQSWENQDMLLLFLGFNLSRTSRTQFRGRPVEVLIVRNTNQLLRGSISELLLANGCMANRQKAILTRNGGDISAFPSKAR